MPIQLTDLHSINMLSRKKQQLEAKLAREMYKVFDSGQAIQTVRRFVTEMVWYMTHDPRHQPLENAISDPGCVSMQVWNTIPTKSANGLQHFFSHDMYIKRLNATDCADLMRLAGTWVEKGGSFAGEQGRHVDLEALKEAHRKGLPETRFPEQSGGGAHGDPAKAWSVGGGHLGSKTAYRDRGPLTETFEGKPAGIEFHLRPFMRDTKSFSGMGGMPGSGTAGKRARGNSTIKKLDKLFGFIIGCDISGTTTDMAFALDNLSFRQGGLHPGYYLLPLATLVHNNHHTILEAALALGLDEKLDYRIGFYTSLIPPQGLPPELEAIRGLLEKAESDVSTARMHLMCYYERGLLAGAFQFNRQELPALRGTVVGTEMLRAALRMQPLPGRDEVKKLLPRTSAMALV